MDFFTVPTLSFQVLYVLVILKHHRRRVVHWAVTPVPTAGWLRQQLREAFPYDTAPQYLILDRDALFNAEVGEFIRALGTSPVRISPRSPWQSDGWALFGASCWTMSWSSATDICGGS